MQNAVNLVNMTNKRKIINDPVYGFITIEDEIVYDVISHPYFQRLRNIKQLGFTYLVYPGAVHSRFAHSVGAFGLMCRALEVLRTKGVDITPEEALGAKLAILLHDIGHGPYSHTLEHTLIPLPHEEITRLIMQRMNGQMQGRLSLAISIFEDSYPKHFLHQLVSSQLDMDRLDYLGRDSFFTGVSEGIVGTDRLINMLNVHQGELVVDEKGVYSVEKFIVSRRLMYWQVYLHKTVVAADAMLLAALRRAQELGLRWIAPDKDFLDQFTCLDDSDIHVSLKQWAQHSDFVLRTLAASLVNRRLPSLRIAAQPLNEEALHTLRDQTQLLLACSPQEATYFVGTGLLENRAYSFNDQEISVHYKDGRCLPISEASDQLDRHFLEKSVKKYYAFFPKELN